MEENLWLWGGKIYESQISKVSVKCVQQLFGFSSSPSSCFANITFLSILTRHCCSRSTVSAKSGQWVEESSSCMSPHSITAIKMIIKALMIMKIVLWPFLILRANHLRPRQSRCRWCPKQAVQPRLPSLEFSFVVMMVQIIDLVLFHYCRQVIFWRAAHLYVHITLYVLS